MQKVHGVAFDPATGQARAAANVQVNVSGGGAASLFADDEVTPLANPLLTDSKGRFAFKTADGDYDLVVSGAGFTTYTLDKVQVADKDNFAAAVHSHPLPDHTHLTAGGQGSLLDGAAIGSGTVGADRLGSGHVGGQSTRYLREDSVWNPLGFGNTGTGFFTGLHMRHSHDTSLPLRVILDRADVIVMSDGEPIQDWDNLTMDLNTIGAGGRDSASSLSFKPYEIYAIAKADGTKNVIATEAPFHNRDIGTDDASWTDDGTHMLRRATAPVNTKLAQSFTAAGGAYSILEAKLIKAGAPTGNIWFTIEADSGANSPSGTPLWTSPKIDVSLFATTAQIIALGIFPHLILNGATVYWVVLQGDYAASDTVNLQWRADTTASAMIPNGAKAFFDGANWTVDTDDDFFLNLFTWGKTNALVLPSGYTRYQHIGYALADSTATKILRFVQRDRKVRMTGLRSEFQVNGATIVATTTPSRIMLENFPFLSPQLIVPPRPAGRYIKGRFAGAPNTAAATFASFASLPIGFALEAATQPLTTGAAFVTDATIRTAPVFAASMVVPIECGRIYVAAGANVNLYLPEWEW